MSTQAAYYPFGLQHGSYNTPARDYRPIGDAREIETVDRNPYKYKYNSKEWQDELGLDWYDYSARNYDASLGRWMNVDRFSEKYYSHTPYHYTKNNPVFFVDINGDSLDIGTDKCSRRDINLLVRNKNEKYIQVNEKGNLSLDFGDLSAEEISDILKEDGGLNLIKDLVSADEKYLYESSEVFLGRTEGGVKGGLALYDDNTAIVNASIWGCDSSDKLTILPREGYDGQVTIRTNASFSDSEGNKSRGAVVFHELAESYERTTNSVGYNGTDGAHNRAINREKKWSGASSSPGHMAISNPKPSKKKRSALRQLIIQYRKK